MSTNQNKAMSWLTLAFLMVAAVASVRSLPGMAVYGLGSVFLYLVPALVFFIPVSLVAAELGTGWNGGIYGWVKQAYGEKWGFFVMWFLWLEVVTWYPTALAFAASTLAYMFHPELAKSGVFTAVVIVVLYWISTFVALKGMNAVSKLSSWFMILGTLFPAALLIVLGVVWLAVGRKSAQPMTLAALIPDVFSSTAVVTAGSQKLHLDFWQRFEGGAAGLVLVVGNFLAFAGIEMNAVHVRELKNPQRDVPRSLLVAAILIVLIFVPPTLAISFVVPADSTSLTAGVMQAYADFFQAFHMSWAIKIMALLLVFGALGGVLAWTAGPSVGLLFVGKAGSLPPWFQKTNKQGIQANILVLQAVLVSLLALLYVVVPDVSGAFWMLGALAVQMYLIVYVFMFAAAMKLRKTQPNVKRGYRAPAIHFWSILGILSSVLALLLGFLPPSQFKMLPPAIYVGMLVAGLVVTAAPAFLFFHFRKPSWQIVPKQESDRYSAALQDLDAEAAASAAAKSPPAAGVAAKT